MALLSFFPSSLKRFVNLDNGCYHYFGLFAQFFASLREPKEAKIPLGAAAEERTFLGT